MATEHLVFQTNLDGERATVCTLRIMVSEGPRKAQLGRTVAIARGKSLTSFVVIERADSPDGFSDQQIYKQICGVPQ